ncbi:MAG: hypothetical protein M3Y56_09795 [Armatimonadota bacterium]|nr:hypothetical protein [Armatimonadota bacterium]
MKIRIFAVAVSTAFASSVMLIAPTLADVNADSSGTVRPASEVAAVQPAPQSDMNSNTITFKGVSGTWVRGVDEPVVPGVVVSQDTLADRAVVRTSKGRILVRTGPGTSVLYNGSFVNWQNVALGSVVQIPMSLVVNGPAPHRRSSGQSAETAGAAGMTDVNAGATDDMDMANGRINLRPNDGFMTDSGMNDGDAQSRGDNANWAASAGAGNSGISGASMSVVSNAGTPNTRLVATRNGHNSMAMPRSRFGGPVYTGDPMLKLTSSLVAAGGGGDNFSTARALSVMVGDTLLTQEVDKLTKQYGKQQIDTWLSVFDFVVIDGLKEATAAGVQLPDSTQTGMQLATALVGQGVGPQDTFYTELLLDKLVSHGIHMKVMEDIDAQYSPAADADYHRITNQAMFDLAQALGARSVKLARFH